MLFILGTWYLNLRALRLHTGEVCCKRTRHCSVKETLLSHQWCRNTSHCSIIYSNSSWECQGSFYTGNLSTVVSTKRFLPVDNGSFPHSWRQVKTNWKSPPPQGESNGQVSTVLSVNDCCQQTTEKSLVSLPKGQVTTGNLWDAWSFGCVSIMLGPSPDFIPQICSNLMASLWLVIFQLLCCNKYFRKTKMFQANATVSSRLAGRFHSFAHRASTPVVTSTLT